MNSSPRRNARRASRRSARTFHYCVARHERERTAQGGAGRKHVKILTGFWGNDDPTSDRRQLVEMVRLALCALTWL